MSLKRVTFQRDTDSKDAGGTEENSMPVNNNKLGKRVRYYREHKGMTQEGLARDSHITKDYVIKLEGGKRMPSLDTFVDIANALQVSADELLSESIERKQPEFNPKILELLVECNETEEKILLRSFKEYRRILEEFGI